MSDKTKEKLDVIIELNKGKENLGMVNLHQTRELLMDAGAILLDVRPPAKVNGGRTSSSIAPASIKSSLV